MDSKFVVAASANDVEMVDAPAQPAPPQLSQSPSPSPSPSPGPSAGSNSSSSLSSAPPSPSQSATPSDEAEESGSDYSAISVESSDFGDESSSPEGPLPRSAPKRPVGSPTPEPAAPITARVIILRFKVQERYDPPGTVADQGKTIGRLDGLCVNRSTLLSSSAGAGGELEEDLSSSTAGVLSSLGLAGLKIDYNEDRLLAVDLHAALAWLYANFCRASPDVEEDYASFIAACQGEIQEILPRAGASVAARGTCPCSSRGTSFRVWVYQPAEAAC
ncbi:hypothetical protein V8F33_009269 [Rhypophila sp. PSN 637]